MHCIPHLCCGDVWGVSLGHCDEGIFQPARCDVQRESWNSNGSLRRPPLAVNQQSCRRQDCHVFICFRHIRMSPLVPGQVSDFPCFARLLHTVQTIEVSYDDGTSMAFPCISRPISVLVSLNSLKSGATCSSSIFTVELLSTNDVRECWPSVWCMYRGWTATIINNNKLFMHCGN